MIANSLARNSTVLLDTHVFVWALDQPGKLGLRTVALITSSKVVYVSSFSLLEMAIKHKQGKFPYDTEMLLSGIEGSGFNLLDLSAEHIQVYGSIELPHHDPFDTMLVAQSEFEGCRLITADTVILGSKYQLFDARD